MRIILRSEWGARHDNGSGSAPLPASEVWLHHSVTASAGPSATQEQDAAKIRDIEAVGESRFGTGISYTWLITEAGRIFEGHSVGRLGTHTGGRNSIARAICLVGNYDNLTPTPAQLVAVAWLLQKAKAEGWIRQARLNGGHRDVKATGCPGNKAYAVIGQINALAAGAPITNTTEADPLSWTENLTFTAPDGTITTIQARDWVMWTNFASWQALYQAQANGAAIAALANDPDITPEMLTTAVNNAIAAQAPIMVSSIISSLKDDLSETVLDVLGSDNAEQAELIAQRTLALVSAKLAAVGTPPPAVTEGN